MTRRHASVARMLAAMIALALAGVLPSAWAGKPADERTCAIVSDAPGERIEPGDAQEESTRSARYAAIALARRLQVDRYVVKAVVGGSLDRDVGAVRERAALTRDRCSTAIDVAPVYVSGVMGSYFGFDVSVRGALTQAEAPSYLKRYRYLADRATTNAFRYDAFADIAFEDLRSANALEGLLGMPVDALQVRAEYDRLAALWPSVQQQELPQQQELHVRHILVESEIEGRNVLSRLLDGEEKFEEVAKSASKDKATAARGGDLGWGLASAYAPEFARAVLALAPQGLTRKPVRTALGWDVIEVLGQRPSSMPPFDEVKSLVEANLRWKLVVPEAEPPR